MQNAVLDILAQNRDNLINKIVAEFALCRQKITVADSDIRRVKIGRDKIRRCLFIIFDKKSVNARKKLLRGFIRNHRLFGRAMR